MRLKSIKNVKNLKGKTVLCRVDLNVGLTDGKLDEFSEFKIKQAMPTVRWLLDRGARVVLMSHYGRPKGRDKKFSLRPFLNYLRKELGHRPGFLKDLKGSPEIIKHSKARVFLLENLRFYPGEEKNDSKFARQLAELGDLYVNEAFASSHRAHASVSAITRLLPSYAGPLLEQEILNLSKLLAKPKRPFVILLGGVKISTKASVIQSLSKRADYILLGGALAHPFLAAKGYNIGRSFTEQGSVKLAKKLLGKKIILPVDVVVVSGKEAKRSASVPALTRKDSVVGIKPINLLSKNDCIADIGPATVVRYSEFLRKAATIVWNGPMGLFEQKEFSYGSAALGTALASRSRGKAFAVVGGGETLAVLARTGMQEYIDWVSTGGGAMLEFLAGKKLPGIQALMK